MTPTPLPMNGRQRLTALLRRQPVDRLAWTAFVDDPTISALPPEMRGRSGFDFYRHLGSDVLELNAWGFPIHFPSPILDWGPGVEERTRQDGGLAIRELVTPHGTLTSTFRGAHPVRHPVASLDDIRTFRALWEQASYRPADEAAPHAQLAAAIGDQGIYTRFWGPSTIPRLLEYDMGTEGFYYLLNDHPEDVEALIHVMHEKELDAFRILSRCLCDSVTLCENTSTYYISPDIYQRFNGPHVKDFVDIIQAAGKVAIIHMCGHVRQLLPLIRDTGLDGVHALTPPHTGDTPWELALDVLGDDLIIMGALPPDLWITGPLDGIARNLDLLYTPRLRRSHFLLGVFADGICVPQERFEAVAAWMRKNGGMI